MFQKICLFATLACFSGVAFGVEKLPQVVTSEVFYEYEPAQYAVQEKEIVTQNQVTQVPVWPLAGSDADFKIACDDMGCADNVAQPVVEYDFNASGTGWSGGPDIDNGRPVPAGFDNECENNAEMPLLRREMLEDDGGAVLAVSRSARKKCNKNSDSYAVFAERAGFAAEKTCDKSAVVDEAEIDVMIDTDEKISESNDEQAPVNVRNQVRSWVVASGQTLRQVLQSWCDREGWDLVWTTSREYPIEASAVFKGRFVDVASALVRNFERATPIPYAKFYKGNRVIVVSTSEE